MRFDRKDGAIAGIAVLIVGVFLATHEAWGVPLVGDSRRWAAAVILALALAAGVLSAPGSAPRSYVLGGLVLASFLFAVLALATASLTPLSLLVLCILALVAVWIGRHSRSAHHGPSALQSQP